MFSLTFLILLLSTPGLAHYSWTGTLDPGAVLYVNNLTVTADREISGNRSIIIINNNTVVFENEKRTIDGLTFEVHTFNNKTYVSISSDKPFEINFLEPDEVSKIRALEEENKRLKQKIRELTKSKNSNNTNFNEMQLKLLNLTKENRELKEKLANVTKKLNYLEGENKYLKEQLKTYQDVFSGMISRVEQHAEEDYVGQAEEKEKAAKRLWATLAISTLLVGGFGLLLYRKKRKYFYE